MGKIIQFALGLLGSGGMTMSLPLIAGVAGAALIALASLGYYAHVQWENFKTGLRNEGAMACVNSVAKAEHEKLQQDYVEMIARLGRERARAAQLEQEKLSLQSESASQHETIAAAMKGKSCTVPDSVVKAINAPLKLTTEDLKKEPKK